jgi:acetylornithine deacetylase/succinyl-diaminopimelate desuccinylase-like protein
VPPSHTRLDVPFVDPVRDAVRVAWGRRPYLQPRLGGTTPDFVFTRELGVPSLIVPYGPPDMHHHAPNERMDLEALHRGVRTSAAICLRLASAVPASSAGGQEPDRG